ncbi:hypothetical protein [Enterococcus hirae]|uniref:hypothetical protein n=1 Tax=Enterococcus hirae TaxID=1354 RepID=UPI001378AA59|nr:hypothetical protein [Enterococcus hirae]NBA56625.1 hypothetical protein [Enterococcus hirae]
MSVSKRKSLCLFQIIMGILFGFISAVWFENIVQADEWPVPTIEEGTTADSMNLKVQIHQALPLQTQEKNLDPLVFTVDLGVYTEELTEQNVQFKLTDHQTGIDLSDCLSFPIVKQGTDQPSTTLDFHLSSEQLNSIIQKVGQVEQLDLELTVPLNATDEKLMTVYNAATQQFDLPVSVENSAGKAETVVKIAAPIPTGSAVSQAVSLGTTTDQLDVADCVTDLHSGLEFDKIKVVGFKEKVSFDTVGNQNVTVLIESEKTGKQAEIPVSITVSEDAESVPTAYTDSGYYYGLFKDYNKTIVTDSYTGEVIKGGSLPDLSNTIVLGYVGEDLISDSYEERGGNIYKIKSFESLPLMWAMGNDTLIIDKMGLYQGEYVKLKITPHFNKNHSVYRSSVNLSITFGKLVLEAYPGSAGTTLDINLDLQVLDKNNQPLEGKDFIFNFISEGGLYNRSKQVYTQSDQVTNYIISNNSFLYKNTAKIEQRSPYEFKPTLLDEIIEGGAGRHDILNFAIYYKIPQGQKSHGTIRLVASNRGNSESYRTYFDFDLFNPDIELPFKQDLPAPSIIGQTNKKTMNLQATVNQYIPKQGFNDYYEDVSLTIDLGKYIDKDKIDKSNFTLKNELTETVSIPLDSNAVDIVTLSNGNTGIQLDLTKKQIQDWISQYGNRPLNLQLGIDVPLNTNDEQIMDAYDKDTQQFQFPISVDNVINHSDSTAHVAMQKPTGEGVTQTSSMGLSTDDLNPADCVTNLHSVLGFDQVKVIGFKEKVEFNTTGVRKPIVLVESEKTGVQGEVVVTINVLNEPVLAISVPKEVKLENKGLEAIGTGEISCTGIKENTKINVTVPEPVKIKYDDNEVSLHVYNEKDDYVRSGDSLTELSSQSNKKKFTLKTKRSAFQEKGIYNGQMTFKFTKLNL